MRMVLIAIAMVLGTAWAASPALAELPDCKQAIAEGNAPTPVVHQMTLPTAKIFIMNCRDGPLFGVTLIAPNLSVPAEVRVWEVYGAEPMETGDIVPIRLDPAPQDCNLLIKYDFGEDRPIIGTVNVCQQSPAYVVH